MKGYDAMKKKIKFYWFHFADGYKCCCRGMSAQEKKVEERKHGKLLRKELEVCFTD